MRPAILHLIGRHDFKSFEGTGSPREHSVRTVTESELTDAGAGNLIFDIRANGFLRFMVRNIVGTLVEVGLGKRSAQSLEAVLDSRDRSQAGATAPPQGLFLVKVIY